ncbi:MAG: restriction endonuclease subunit S [Prevotellaceae bacterium]|jgi:type I restriction enzyme S subunit|nr:restriction endonuclease subunit S [Prevotellaceae bacterium]
MDTKKLRQKILDLAIRGKLVPQDPNDEPASVLLERIWEEKERLIKEGKIKRDKKEKTSDTSHYRNVPFEVPEGWVWESIGNLCSSLQYGTSEKSLSEGKVAVLRMGNISPIGELIYEDLVFTSNDNDIFKYTLILGDLLFNRTNSSEWVGKTAIYRGEIPAIYAGYIIRFRPIFLNLEYVHYVMNSNYEKEYCQSVKTDGVNQSNINSQKLANFFIPIPPLQEQSRIVSKIKECFTLIDQIEEKKLSLTQFIKQTKFKVLDLAIHGKLVPQNPDDEPASVLLEQSKKEHKPKKLTADISHYTDNDFQIPDNWEITTMQNICYLSDGEKIDNKVLPYLDVKYLRGKSDAKMLSSGKFVSKNNTMILVDGENSGELFSVTEDGYQGSTFKILNISDFVDKDFIFKILQKEQSTFRESKVGSAIPHLDKKLFRELAVFLPPLTEQKRIVEKVENIFQTLDSIQNNL